MRSPVVFTRDEDGLVMAEFPDVPSALTVGRAAARSNTVASG